MMEFTECKESGHLKADGKQGQYWIEEYSWTYLSRVVPTRAGPKNRKLGVFYDVKTAEKTANQLDEAGL